MSTKFKDSVHTFGPLAISPVVIREATEADRAALARVAERDSSAVPAGEVLVAESDGEIRAAIEVEGARAVADPFRPTAELLDLLRTRAGQIRGARRRPLRILARTPSRQPSPLRQRAA
jgi:ketosteroid isomerase-like protein